MTNIDLASPEARNERMRGRWADQMARDRAARSNGKDANGHAQSAPADTIAEALTTRKNRLDDLEANLKGIDERAGLLRKRKETCSPKERVEIEHELNSLAVMRDTAVVMISEGRDQLTEVEKRHQQAQRDAANRIEDVINSTQIAARAYREALRSALTALQTIESTWGSVEVLCGPLRMTKQNFAASCFEVGIAPRYFDMPGMGAIKPQTLEQSLENHVSNARTRRAELKQKGNGR